MICADWNVYGRVFMSTADVVLPMALFRALRMRSDFFNSDHQVDDCLVGDRLDLLYTP